MEDMMDNKEVTEIIDSQVEGATDEDSIQISLKALLEINNFREQNEVPEEFYLRLATQGGGCSGMQYVLGFDDKINENDRVFETENYKLVIDTHSLFYYMGVTLDYTDGPDGSGFVFRGLNNMRTCGCSV
jgi:iron-sulfur cluster assembly protein